MERGGNSHAFFYDSHLYTDIVANSIYITNCSYPKNIIQNGYFEMHFNENTKTQRGDFMY